MSESEIIFFEDTHQYLLNGKPIPSVTDIISPLHRSYGKINPAVLDQAARRGTAVHEALEMMDYGADFEVFPETAPYIMAYQDWAEVYRPIWTGIEEIVFSEGGWYAGTLDRIGYFNGGDKLNIVDIKTSQPTKEALVSVCIQTYAYASAYDNSVPIERWGLFLKPDGTWRFQNCMEYEKKYGFFGWDVWRMLLRTHNMINDLLATRGKK